MGRGGSEWHVDNMLNNAILISFLVQQTYHELLQHDSKNGWSIVALKHWLRRT